MDSLIGCIRTQFSLLLCINVFTSLLIFISRSIFLKNKIKSFHKAVNVINVSVCKYICVYAYMIIQGFRKHELHDPLLEPGSADLTADVDFSYLKGCAKEGTKH